MKKLLSVILSLVLILSALTCAPVNAADDAPGTDIPLIYVVGQGTPLFRNREDGSREQIYPITVPDGFIEAAVKENIGIFAKAVLTQEWEEFGAALHDILFELFGTLALDENGNTTDGSYTIHGIMNENINASRVNGKYPTERFTFQYDFRLDPYKVADDLHACIEKVMAATGADHVALLGRCLGGCITAAYMDKYNGEYVSDFIQYCSALKGATVCSKLLSGDLYLDPDGIERFIYDFELTAEGVTNDLIQSFVTLFNKTYGLDIACWSVNNVYPDIYLDILPNVLIDTFGTWPGYWSMVSEEDYDRAKDTIFHNADMDKWANFIDIIDNYHYNVQEKAEENLAKYADSGIDVFNVSKYGFQAIPVNAPADMISDQLCELSQASFGAAATSLNTPFSDEYLANAEANGTAKYIAPDRQVDASACLFPERTWFIKNLAHKDFPTCVNGIFDLMVNEESFDINSNESYPQFMVYDGGNLSPMTGENQNTTERYFHTFWDALKTFVKSLSTVIRNYIEAQKAEQQ